MLPTVEKFPPEQEAAFRASRIAALAVMNVGTYWLVALLVLLFSFWDWYVDPVNWTKALAIRVIGAVIIVATGLIQRTSKRTDWAPTIARVRYTATVIAVAGAIAVLKDGFVVGLAGLMAVLFAGPYIALDRREIFVLNVVPLVLIAFIMFAIGLDRFAATNAAIFIALAIAVSLLLARVFEASNRRAFALEQELMREARTDALTGLANRRALDEAASQHVKRAARSGRPLSVILCDIDHFKIINDRHGHDVGDKVIRAVAAQLRDAVRDTDALGRWGGEEFLIILPDTDGAEARILAERIRAAIEAAAQPLPNDAHVTISLGVSSVGIAALAQDNPWAKLVKSADDAMYRAKAAGRNRVEV